MTRTAARLLLRLRHGAKTARELFGELRVWVFGAGVGVVGGYAILGFLAAIDAVSMIFYGVDDTMLASAGRALPWPRVALAPVVGGILVSAVLLLAKRFNWLPEARPQGITEVIESRAIAGRRISLREGVASSIVATLSLGSGASAGREGPAVHLGAAVAQKVTDTFGLRARDARTLLGCGAAAAVSASFNAPIAGVLFALEVILGNYALSIFGPVVLASVIAAVIARMHLGDFPAFSVPIYAPATSIDVPFAAALGAVSGLTALAFLFSVSSLTRVVRDLCRRTKTPTEILPVLAGVVIGGIGVFYPEVLSVGYEATQNALENEYGVRFLTIILILKILATSITLSCRFGGGVFSSGVYLGAMTGAAFGIVLGQTFGGLTAEPTFYAMVGIGAVGGAILGAPISTTLIVFELTRDYQITIALMAAVSVATLITQTMFGRSYFHWQLSRRGYDLSDGPQGVILQTTRVRDVMTRMPDAEEPISEEAPRLRVTDNLGDALAAIEAAEKPGLPVVGLDDEAMPIGYLSRIKALAAYNKALVDLHVEHHR